MDNFLPLQEKTHFYKKLPFSVQDTLNLKNKVPFIFHITNGLPVFFSKCQYRLFQCRIMSMPSGQSEQETVFSGLISSVPTATCPWLLGNQVPWTVSSLTVTITGLLALQQKSGKTKLIFFIFCLVLTLTPLLSEDIIVFYLEPRHVQKCICFLCKLWFHV